MEAHIATTYNTLINNIIYADIIYPPDYHLYDGIDKEKFLQGDIERRNNAIYAVQKELACLYAILGQSQACNFQNIIIINDEN
jgi:hypothetical protein